MYTAVLGFVDALADLPRDSWLTIGQSLRADANRLAALSSARAILDVVIANNHLAIPAWHVTDAVETAAYVAEHGMEPLSQRERRVFEDVQRAAEEAALALLAREHLADAEFTTLYAPFAERIPVPAPDSPSAV